jgi:hypothetical protein
MENRGNHDDCLECEGQDLYELIIQRSEAILSTLCLYGMMSLWYHLICVLSVLDIERPYNDPVG